MTDTPPIDPADHTEDFAHRYERDLDAYCAIRMGELGIPRHLHGAPDFGGDGKWRAFIAHDRVGGRITTASRLTRAAWTPIY